MTKIIAVADHKGGVGKTTTSLNLAHALVADRETTVLLCDLDPQASLTRLLGFQTEKLTSTLYDLLLQTQPRLTAGEVAQSTSMLGIHGRSVLEARRAALPDRAFQSVIASSARAKDSVAAAQSIFSYDPESAHAEACRGLAHELITSHA